MNNDQRVGATVLNEAPFRCLHCGGTGRLLSDTCRVLLRHERTARGWSLRYVAGLLGVSPALLSMLENGKRHAPELLERYLVVLCPEREVGSHRATPDLADADDKPTQPQRSDDLRKAPCPRCYGTGRHAERIGTDVRSDREDLGTRTITIDGKVLHGKAQVSQRMLASMAGVHFKQVQRLERGLPTQRPDLLHRVQQALRLLAQQRKIPWPEEEHVSGRPHETGAVKRTFFTSEDHDGTRATKQASFHNLDSPEEYPPAAMNTDCPSRE